VRCDGYADLVSTLEALEGQLTIAVHMDGPDEGKFQSLLPLLEEKAGRVLVNDFGTGVEVGYAMVHGGPFPATSDSRTTSVGARAIQRFLRPVAYQDLPQAVMPVSLNDANPLHISRLVDGILEKGRP
jgi:NADP-dependent aldehyde dehydrogenase